MCTYGAEHLEMDEVENHPGRSRASTLAPVLSSTTATFSVGDCSPETSISTTSNKAILKDRGGQPQDSPRFPDHIYLWGSCHDAKSTATDQYGAIDVKAVEYVGHFSSGEVGSRSLEITQNNFGFRACPVRKPGTSTSRQTLYIHTDLEQGITHPGGRNVQHVHQGPAAFFMHLPWARKVLVVAFTLLTISAIVGSSFGIAAGEHQENIVRAKRWLLGGTGMVMAFTFCAMTAAGRQFTESVSIVMLIATIGMGLLGDLEHFL